MQDVKPLIRVNGLRKYFHSQQGWFNKTPPVKAVDGVSFEIYPGKPTGWWGSRAVGNPHSVAACCVCLISLTVKLSSRARTLPT